MKKVILVAALVLGVATAAIAQPRAVGLRMGYGAEASYQHTIGKTNFIEADLGLGILGQKDSTSTASLNVAATYNWMLAQPQWTDRGEWGFYAGAGAALAVGNQFNIGVAGQVGLEYTFWFPLQLSVDIRPQLGLVGGSFNIWGWYPHLSARYRF